MFVCVPTMLEEMLIENTEQLKQLTETAEQDCWTNTPRKIDKHNCRAKPSSKFNHSARLL